MKYSISLLILFAPCLMLGQTASSLIPFKKAAVAIDGALTEETWADIDVFSNFYNHFPEDQGLAEHQTEVKIFHDQKMLYISAVYHDQESRNNVSSLKRDVYNEGILQSDCFGIVIDPYGEGDNGYFFGINASGVQFDALIGNVNVLNESWNAVWKGAVSVSGNNKIYELAIPLGAINYSLDVESWGIQLFINDTKINQFSTWDHSLRNFVQYDLRFTKPTRIEQLPLAVTQRFTVLPSITYNHSKNVSDLEGKSKVTPSLDGQYNISSSLRLDLTLNPDFSQVEVDQQVTNLTRFNVFFPERRKFFLENNDLFNNLGTYGANPFYSRRIGSESDMKFGGKLSGNIGKKTRIGVLNAQTKSTDEIQGKNYTVAVARQNLSNSFLATGYFVNSHKNAYSNNVVGGILNYRSKNNKWRGSARLGKAITSDNGEENTGDNNYLNTQVAYAVRNFDFSVSYERMGKNYILDSGFTPFLFNYDARSQTSTRALYHMLETDIQLKKFPSTSKTIDWFRLFWFQTTTLLNDDGSLRENRIFYSPVAFRFKDRNYVFVSIINTVENLRFNFDILQNENYITPEYYNYTFGRVGYFSQTNKKFSLRTFVEYGQYFRGKRFKSFIVMSYRMLPTAVLSATYEFNDINLNELGRRGFHLARFTSEVYFNNRFNWTTYIQYNTQRDNVNINSRLQWEYQPLSYVYLVATNNFDRNFVDKNWGLSIKVNKRFDF